MLEIKKYILMNKNLELIKLDILKGNISVEGQPLSPLKYFPYTSIDSKGNLIKLALVRWWNSRKIPASRDNLDKIVNEAGLDSIMEAVEDSLGLSLNDSYWIKPVDSTLQWEDVNFFVNNFSEDMGIALDLGKVGDSLNCRSADNTSDGVLKKKWKIIKGKRYLFKGSHDGKDRHLVVRELISSFIAKFLFKDNEYVKYFATDDLNYCYCENFITEESELVSALYVIEKYKKLNHVSDYEHYLNCCSLEGIDVKSHIDRTLILDYIVCNVDRHYRNFGLIMDANSRNFIMPAPVFDTGSCLWYEGDYTDNNSKPFKSNHSEQIKLINLEEYQDGINDIIDNIEDIKNYAYELFSNIYDPDVANKITIKLIERIEDIKGSNSENTLSWF